LTLQFPLFVFFLKLNKGRVLSPDEACYTGVECYTDIECYTSVECYTNRECYTGVECYTGIECYTGLEYYTGIIWLFHWYCLISWVRSQLI
jgi:hypothetical protein